MLSTLLGQISPGLETSPGFGDSSMGRALAGGQPALCSPTEEGEGKCQEHTGGQDEGIGHEVRIGNRTGWGGYRVQWSPSIVDTLGTW